MFSPRRGAAIRGCTARRTGSRSRPPGSTWPPRRGPTRRSCSRSGCCTTPDARTTRDPGHGPRAAVFARELHRDGDLLLDDGRLELLCLALELHADGQVSAHPTVGTCWDADRLHLGRSGRTSARSGVAVHRGSADARCPGGRGRAPRAPAQLGATPGGLSAPPYRRHWRGCDVSSHAERGIWRYANAGRPRRMIIGRCTFDGCTVLTIGSRCVEHDLPVRRTFVRGRPFCGRRVDPIGASRPAAASSAPRSSRFDARPNVRATLARGFERGSAPTLPPCAATT